MRIVVSLLCAAVLVAGCGDSGSSASSDSRTAPATRTTAADSSAPVLVTFQRNGGLAATLDKLTVRRDGSARLDKRYGGAGRRFEDFTLTAATLRHLRASIAALPARLTPSGTPAPQGAHYLLTAGGHTYSAQEGAVGRPGREAVASLNAIVDGGGRGHAISQHTQAPAP